MQLNSVIEGAFGGVAFKTHRKCCNFFGEGVYGVVLADVEVAAVVVMKLESDVKAA